VLKRYAKYPDLTLAVNSLTATVSDTELRLEELRANAASEFDRGLRSGENRSRGIALSASLAAMPAMTSLTRHGNLVAIVTRFDSTAVPQIGAWFQVEVPGTGEVKGAVEVTEVVMDEMLAVLSCCEQDVPEYWQRLYDRADSDAEPPKGVRLRPYRKLNPSESHVVDSAIEIKETQ
jgi:hypothetical protein